MAKRQSPDTPIKLDSEVAPTTDASEKHATDPAIAFRNLGLSELTLAAVRDMGYTEPTPVQAAAIPCVLSGRDVLAAAQTGTGKTAAFLLPALSNLRHAGKGKGPLMLVLTPTRELAQQIEEVANAITARTRHTTAVIVGGLSYEPQKAALQRGCDLLVATPGRLIDLINQGACDLSRVEVLVLDEADRMLDMGFLPDMRRIISHTPDSRQTLLFSATLDEHVLEHTGNMVHDPARVQIAPKGTAADTVEQYVLGVSTEAKFSVLQQILEREGAERVIVFTNGKHRADFICRKLHKQRIKCAPIHGNRNQNQRARALRDFDKDRVQVLVATDVLARGIDVDNVSYVINYDVPKDDPESYIHRIGRTGRAGEKGWALTFVTDDDYLGLRDVEQLMDRVIPDFPRTDGLDLGQSPCQMDPNRDPREKLPTKKQRKRMQDAAKRKAAKDAEKGAAKDGTKDEKTAESPAPKQNRKKASATQKKTAKQARSEEKTKPEEPKLNANGKPQAPTHQRKNKKRRRAGKGVPTGEAVYRPVSGKPKKKGKRHPGDHGQRV